MLQLANGYQYPVPYNHIQYGRDVFWQGDTNISSDVGPGVLNQWDTYGPTGSGADNIWTILDYVPDYATAIILALSLQQDSLAAGQMSFQWRIGPYDIDLSNYSAWEYAAIYHVVDTDAGGELMVRANYQHLCGLPKDGSRIIQTSISITNGDSPHQGSMWYQGYRV